MGSDKIIHFLGLCLSGQKKGKSALAHLSYHQKYKKLALTHISPKIKKNLIESEDDHIVDIMNTVENLQSLHVNATLVPPLCLRCDLVCPGQQLCEQEDIVWLKDYYSDYRKKDQRLSPYSERPVENFLRSGLEEGFQLDQAMGANKGPLSQKFHYIERRLKTKNIYEAFAKISVWRWGRNYGLPKTWLRDYAHAFKGEASREKILIKLKSKGLFFVYDEDHKKMIQDRPAFESFFLALTAYSRYEKNLEPRPKDFPTQTPWPDIPVSMTK